MADLEVKCPTCGTTVVWTSAATYRPFCSKRCHLIDLGDWVTEGHKIPGEPAVDEMMSEELSAEMLKRWSEEQQ